MPENRLLTDTYFAKRDVLLRFLTRLCGDEASAEDVLQDLYIKVSGARLDGEIQEPLAFLFRMANNLYLNRIRAASSHRARDTAWYDLNPQNALEGSGIDGTGADASPDAESVVAARQELRAVMKAIESLPSRTQDIFRLHKIDGLSQTEVARRLDISISSVEKHLSGALKHLLALNRSRH
ncbi:RNA polymerase sigma factor [Asticcacaulis sp. YBE204]|uniref:RNA polymerase sigma factor n=1 Tax=Asticcacaulis sp. YBE204 TaxID=1282363 RepID=UPI0003C3C963|nr:RNA polymerase sigma factor [Asticcacaulis sp. YBE204]ESQ78331.1 hypothetical protein AEYBE204_14260 [Asticcacaulis sp. YBE204]